MCETDIWMCIQVSKLHVQAHTADGLVFRLLGHL
jgi:hypothetical protein